MIKKNISQMIKIENHIEQNYLGNVEIGPINYLNSNNRISKKLKRISNKNIKKHSCS